jgi:hypothetical protein
MIDSTLAQLIRRITLAGLFFGCAGPSTGAAQTFNMCSTSGDDLAFLIRAAGLVRWPSDPSNYRSDYERYVEARIFLNVLYGSSQGDDYESAKSRLILLRS